MFYDSKIWRDWAPVTGRVFLGLLFLVAAFFKIPGTASFSREVAFTAKAGVPLANLAVFLAFILELLGGAALILGWKARLIGAVLALYTILLTLIFHLNLTSQTGLTEFISHLGLIGGLLYMSVYGANYAALSKDEY